MAARTRVRSSFVVVAIATIVTALGVTAPLAADGPTRASAQGASGTIRIAAEGEPLCADWIASCAGSAWGNWVLGNHTLPQALNVDSEGSYVPSSLLVDLPTVDPGPPMRITYRIKPEAVWSDGTPITSADFEYTWQQIVKGRDIYDKTGYVDIESIDTSDPKTAVVTMRRPFAAWRDLFGGFYFVLPKHLLDGKNRHRIMRDGYEFSGGPWKLENGRSGWRKGRSITLVPNDAYWGTKPSIGKVVFQFIPESSAELQAVKTGQVVAAYPLPIDGAVDELSESPNLRFSVSYGNQFEAFWINADQFPLDSQAVRQAIAYATDRQAIVEQILRPAVNEGRVLQSFIVPTFRTFYEPAFERYAPDQAMVDQLMTGDGWTRNDDGIWEKDGRTASFKAFTTAGNEARERTLELWQSQLRQAGFDMTFRGLAADVLFGERLPSGRFDVGLFASVGTPDPGLCLIFCSGNIPSRRNDFAGSNITRTDDPVIDETWAEVDTRLDVAARADAARRGQRALAEYVASIPLFQTPTIFVYDSDRLGGRLEDNSVMGPFFTMNEWTLQ